MTDLALFELAAAAREHSYAPYSGFRVGAALLASDGRVFVGCNVENAAYSATCCAERVALFKAVSEGVRSFVAIAVAGGKGEHTDVLCAPCGVCRQVLSEFCGPSLRVILADANGIQGHSLQELLPLAFSGAVLDERGDRCDENV